MMKDVKRGVELILEVEWGQALLSMLTNTTAR
jgi:hypothetical protein